MEFLPITRREMLDRGWDACDFVYIIGDAYVDHPSFGHAIISRVLESHGYNVGIISQPDWKNPKSIDVFGRPRLGFLISGGNMDSMVNHYSVTKHHRKTDAFTPGGVMGKRPDYATTVYCNLIRQTYKDVPILIGGIEASLRRLGHYDYWSDTMKRSILLDSQADLLMYGMGEKTIVEVADALNSGLDVKDITYIDGTVFKTKAPDDSLPTITLPSFAEIKADRRRYAESFKIQYANCDPFTAKRLAEPYDNFFVVQNPPQKPLTTAEMDAVYDLPYMRAYHPSYEKAGGVPAIEEVKFSLVSNRGCFGACSFCALTFHQGRIVQTRSHESILREAEIMVKDKDFKGYIHDVGGPTANFRFPSCREQMLRGMCSGGKHCLAPTTCSHMIVDHSDYLKILRRVRELPGVKKVFIRSGIRFDYLMADPDDTFFKELVEYHVSGQLKVAPEHCAPNTLAYMGKPPIETFNKFKDKFYELSKKAGKKQYLVPYLMSSHPGSTLKDAVYLAEYLYKNHMRPEQVQDFYPTPGTVSTCMFYTGLDPYTLKPVFVEKTPEGKALQRALLQYYEPRNAEKVVKALKMTHREDLIPLLVPAAGRRAVPQQSLQPNVRRARCRRAAEAPERGDERGGAALRDRPVRAGPGAGRRRGARVARARERRTGHRQIHAAAADLCADLPGTDDPLCLRRGEREPAQAPRGRWRA